MTMIHLICTAGVIVCGCLSAMSGDVAQTVYVCTLIIVLIMTRHK